MTLRETRIRFCCYKFTIASAISTSIVTSLFCSSSFAFIATSTAPNKKHMFPLHHQYADTTSKGNQNGGLFYSSGGGSGDDAFDLHVLQERIQDLKLTMLEEDLHRPPNANLSPKTFVESIFQGLLHNEEPFPSSGFKLLLRASTDNWKRSIYDSIGAPLTADIDVVASALGEALGRPRQQFAILVGEEDQNNFYINFPSEELDFLDGTCWIECVLRDKRDSSLMVATGWSLRQRPEDGAWLVDKIDWQDFREAYRPGIGREEWMPFEG